MTGLFGSLFRFAEHVAIVPPFIVGVRDVLPSRHQFLLFVPLPIPPAIFLSSWGCPVSVLIGLFYL